MTRSGTAAIFFAILILILSGCACVTVTKLSPDSDTSAIKGQRFSLPRPYIQVTPQTDGSISADIVYLPDPERTYAVNSFSVFASDSLEVSTDGGIVKTINWTGDSSAVVAEAIASAGTAASGILQAEQTKKAEQKAKEDTASKAVDDAQLELDLAQSTLAFHIANNAAREKILEARLAVQDAALKLSAAQASLARLRGIAKADANFQTIEETASKAVDEAQSELTLARGELEKLRRRGAASQEIEQAQGEVKTAMDKLRKAQITMAEVTGKVFGPKLFAIREEIRMAGDKPSPYLQIVTVEQQADSPPKDWDSSQPKYPVKWPDEPKPPNVRIFPEGMNSVPDQNNNRWLTLQSSVPLVALVAKETIFKKDGNKLPAPPPITLTPPTLININLEGFSGGNYTLDLAYQTRAHEKPDEKDGITPVNIKILK